MVTKFGSSLLSLSRHRKTKLSGSCAVALLSELRHELKQESSNKQLVTCKHNLINCGYTSFCIVKKIWNPCTTKTANYLWSHLFNALTFFSCFALVFLPFSLFSALRFPVRLIITLKRQLSVSVSQLVF